MNLKFWTWRKKKKQQARQVSPDRPSEPPAASTNTAQPGGAESEATFVGEREQ